MQTMTKFGHNHWTQINLLPGSKENYTSPFEFNLSPGKYDKTMSFSQAATYTAKLINSKFDNIHLCLSGGLDSEFIAQTFLDNRIKFTPVILINLDNRTEAWYAQRFCKLNNLTPIVNLLAELLPDAHLVTGLGDPLYISNDYHEPMGNVFEMFEHDFYLNIEYGDYHPNAFYSYTPELFFSMVRDIDCTINSQEAKSKLYNLLPRPKIEEVFVTRYSSESIKYVYQQLLSKYNLPENFYLYKICKDNLLSL
jgi:hypothetical protein